MKKIGSAPTVLFYHVHRTMRWGMLERMERMTRFVAERMAPNGAALSAYNGKPLAVFGLFPGEEAIVEVRKGKRGYEGVVREFCSTRAERRQPFELHYLACSPWQTIDYALQAELKKSMLAELFSGVISAEKVQFHTATVMSGYRTKMEFSFADRGQPLELAFHERGRKFDRTLAPEGCILAGEHSNAVSRAITKKLKERDVPSAALKSLIVRESKCDGKTIAILYAKAEIIPEFSVSDIEGLAGFCVYHSTDRSPASVPTRELWSTGTDALVDRVLGYSFQYAHDAFFQNNIPMFELALSAITSEVRGPRVVELYSGVGVIGIAVAGTVADVTGVEIIPSAVENATANAQMNGIANYQAILAPAEKALEAISGADTLILDPPRVGLHTKLLAAISVEKPGRIVYLSCNPESQARDTRELIKAGYHLVSLAGYDFYPQTPHCESLAVFEAE